MNLKLSPKVAGFYFFVAAVSSYFGWVVGTALFSKKRKDFKL